MSGAGIEGMVLDKYKILKKVGAGAMGAVFRAEDSYTKEIIALKILAPKLAKDDSYLRRFKREVRAARELNHPNIIRVFDAGEYKGFHFFTMEFVDGKSVMDLIEDQKRIPLKPALKIVIEVAKALEHAHSIHIVHRDIKPANIIVDKVKGVKLADMGLAKKVGDGGYTEITMAGKIMGTPFYLAPERISEEGDNIDTRADIYSLGATLYHMVTGRVPFLGDAKNPFKVYHQIMYEPVVFPPEINLPDSIRTLILKMMAKSPDQRYLTPKPLLQDLQRALAILEGRQVAPQAGPTSAGHGATKLASQKVSSASSAVPQRSIMGKVVGILLFLLLLSAVLIIFADQIGLPPLIQLKKIILKALGGI